MPLPQASFSPSDVLSKHSQSRCSVALVPELSPKVLTKCAVDGAVLSRILRMENVMKQIIGIFALTIAVSGVALAHASPPPSAPEINPGMAGNALAILGGALLVIRGRRPKF